MPSTTLIHSKISKIELSEPGGYLHDLDAKDGNRVLALHIPKGVEWKQYRSDGEPGDMSRVMQAARRHLGVDEYRTRPPREGYQELFVLRIPNKPDGMLSFLGDLHLSGLITKDNLPQAIDQLELKPRTRADEEITYHI